MAGILLGITLTIPRGADSRSERLDNTLYRVMGRLVFPQANDSPPSRRKQPVGVGISCLVPGNLRDPILSVARWGNIVLAASMPEAAI
jgi:hypothetical protein